jgi:hypothetical protein
VPRVVVEQVRCNATGDPRPAHVAPRTATLVAHRGECPFESWGARRVAVREPDRKTVEQEIARHRRAWTRRGRASGQSDGPHVAAEAAGHARRPERLEIGLPSARAILCFEPLRRVEQERHRLFAASQVQRDLPVEALEHRAVVSVQRSVSSRRQERQRLLWRAGQLRRARGLERAPRPASGVARERSRALKECGGSRQAAACLRPPGRALQLLGDILVGSERGLRAMPRPTIGIDLGIG